jgi:EmrB/QacA subfamily drug resistance transporter
MMPTADSIYGSPSASTAGTLPFAVGIGTMCIAAHVSAVGAAFPLIAGQLGSTIPHAQWILTAYTLTLSGCLLTFGHLGDRIGFKRVFIAGMALYAIASAGCALAGGLTALVLLRGLQGIGAAMISAASVALLAVHIPRSRLGSALGWQMGMTYLGLALGPALGGFMAETFGWRSLFLLNVPAAMLAIVAMLNAGAERERPRNACAARPGYLYFLSTAAWFASLVALMMAIGGGQVWLICASAACGFLFVTLDRRSPDPLLPLRIFRNRDFNSATTGETIYYLCLYVAGFLTPLYLIRARGFSTAQVGLLLGAQSAARAIAAPCSGRLIDRFGVRTITAFGLVALVAALCMMGGFTAGTPTVNILASLILLGIGTGFFVPANSKALLGAVPADLYGLSSGFLATARNLGMTLGTGLAAMLFTSFGGGVGAAATLTGMRAAIAATAGLAILYVILYATMPCRRGRRKRSAFPHEFAI